MVKGKDFSLGGSLNDAKGKADAAAADEGNVKKLSSHAQLKSEAGVVKARSGDKDKWRVPLLTVAAILGFFESVVDEAVASTISSLVAFVEASDFWMPSSQLCCRSYAKGYNNKAPVPHPG